MEITPKRYWRRWGRRGYKKIDDDETPSNPRVKKMDPTTRKKKRFWRKIKISKKLRIFKTTSSAKKLLVWIRDSYVNMMMRLANSRVVGSGYGGGSGSGFGSGPMKEYDEKMLVEIYKSILMAQAQGKLVHGDAVDNDNNSKIVGSESEPPVISVTSVVTC